MALERVEVDVEDFRPGKLGATLRISLFSALTSSIGIGTGYIVGSLVHTSPQPAFVLFVTVLILPIFCILTSQLAAQTLLYVRFDGEHFSFRTLFGKHQIEAKTIRNIYSAPNLRYTNVIIDTALAPRLLSDAIWSRRSFAAVEGSLRRWAANQGLQVIDVNTAWAKSQEDHVARKLLLRCFREPYFPSLGIVIGISAVSYLITVLH